MMVKLFVEWNGRRVVEYEWDTIEKVIRQACEEGTMVRIKNPSAGPNEPECLSIQIDEEEGLYLPIISLNAEKPLLFYNNPKATGKLVDFAGGDDPDDFFTNDLDLIISMAREFYETGNVKEIKHMGSRFASSAGQMTKADSEDR